MEDTDRIWFDGNIRNSDLLPVELGSPIFQGGGWFETVAVENGEALNVRAHLDRLERSLPVSLPFSRTRLDHGIGEVARSPETTAVRLKILVWEDTSSQDWHLAIWGQPWSPPSSDRYQDGVMLEPCERAVPPRWPLTNQKRTNYLSVLERRRQSSCDYVLYHDDSTVWECGIANIFWIEDGQLHTPVRDEAILNGTVLEAIIRQFQQSGAPVSERRCSVEDISGQVGVTNSLIGILPVCRIGNRHYSVDPGRSTWAMLRQNLVSDRIIPSWSGG